MNVGGGEELMGGWEKDGIGASIIVGHACIHTLFNGSPHRTRRSQSTPSEPVKSWSETMHENVRPTMATLAPKHSGTVHSLAMQWC